MGSETLQNTSPIPIPALNNIENHSNRVYFGSSSGSPNFISPILLSIIYMATNTNMVPPSIKDQPNCWVIKLNDTSAATLRLSIPNTPQNTNNMVKIKAIQKVLFSDQDFCTNITPYNLTHYSTIRFLLITKIRKY